MTAEEEKTIRLLETRTRQLILKFQQQKEENEELLNELVSKDNELQTFKQKCKDLEAEYKTLKMAKMLEVGDGDIAMARQRINHLVRDVDKFIALLKTMGIQQ
jgi:predicted nuclease with TOPRIM domain